MIKNVGEGRGMAASKLAKEPRTEMEEEDDAGGFQGQVGVVRPTEDLIDVGPRGLWSGPGHPEEGKDRDPGCGAPRDRMTPPDLEIAHKF